MDMMSIVDRTITDRFFGPIHMTAVIVRIVLPGEQTGQPLQLFTHLLSFCDAET